MIRDFRIQDLDRVMELWLDTNILAHDFIKSSYWQSHFDEVKKMMPDATIFIYEQDNAIKGFMGLTGHYIAGIFIESEVQSKGAGKQLLNYAKDRYDELSLHVYQKNNRAVRFYLKENFTITSEHLDKKTGEAEYIMHWKKQAK